MKLVVYGLSVTSSWGNGHATTYRALLRALAARGHTVVFVEKDVEWYRTHRDEPAPAYCTVRLYTDWVADEASLLQEANDADCVIVGSYFPDAIVASRALFATARCPVCFYDIDTPITLAALRDQGATAYLDRTLIPHYAAYLSFTGGPALHLLEKQFHAQRALAFFCSVDPALHRPVAPEPGFAADLSYLGTYAQDRQAKIMQMLDAPAGQLPEQQFLVAGPQYPSDIAWNKNVRRLDHVAPADHPALYCSSRFTLNVTRADMVELGYSPSVRLFEAAACGSAILSDTWDGLANFLTPGEEILLPSSTSEVVAMLTGMSDAERLRIGQRARERILAEHSSTERAIQFEQIVSGLTARPAPRAIADTSPETFAATAHS